MSIHRVRPLRIVLLSSVLVASGWALAAGSAQETIEARQKNLKSLGSAFKTIRDEIRKSDPDAAEIKTAAGEVATFATQIHTWFPQGSGPEAQVKTEAKPEIWTDPAGFDTALKNFQAEAPKLAQFANANDIAGVKGAFGKLGGICKGCHDKYRVPRD